MEEKEKHFGVDTLDAREEQEPDILGDRCKPDGTDGTECIS